MFNQVYHNLSDNKFYKWNGGAWKTHPDDNLTSEIKVILLIYPVPEDLKRRIRQDLDHEPIYLCNWK